jgi:hypothetical protein
LFLISSGVNGIMIKSIYLSCACLYHGMAWQIYSRAETAAASAAQLSSCVSYNILLY